MGMKKCSSQRKPVALLCKRKPTSGMLKICRLSPSVISNVILPLRNLHFHTFCMISTFKIKKQIITSTCIAWYASKCKWTHSSFAKYTNKCKKEMA